jgi:hypothetical protein
LIRGVKKGELMAEEEPDTDSWHRRVLFWADVWEERLKKIRCQSSKKKPVSRR